MEKKTKISNFLPKTAFGKWSIGLIVGSLVFVLLAWLIHTFFSNPAIANMLMLLAGISGMAAFFTGIIGITKSKDRSAIVFTATIIGFFVLLIFIFEGFVWS